MKRRVVVTGMGVCAPNGIGLTAFANAMREGRSGIRHFPELEALGFSCHLGASPEVTPSLLNRYFSPLEQRGLKTSSGLVYGLIAGMQAWEDAGLAVQSDGPPDWNSGICFGTGILGVEKLRESIYLVDAGKTRRLGSTSVPQTMASGISAWLSGKLGCGNQVSTNSSACSTGAEAVYLAMERIRSGRAERMLAGSCSDSGPYVWGGFDAMRILSSGSPKFPEKACRPLSASASGFVPGSGAGALLLESLASARKRGARIYAEVLGGAVNSGGHRQGGSMTAANDEGVQRCISDALEDASITPDAITGINGHLTATSRDSHEVSNWCAALGRNGVDFPFLNSFKDVLGHGLAASGSMECVAALLQYGEKCIFGNTNAADLHPDIEKLIHRDCVPVESIPYTPGILAKASFGFGDVNSCLIFGPV